MNKSFKYLVMKKNINRAKNIFQKFNISLIPIVKKNFELIDVITIKEVIS